MGSSEVRNRRLEQVEQMLASSLTVKEWCKLNKAAESTMYSWLRVFREAGLVDGGKRRNEWIEVTRADLAASTALAVKGPGGTRVAPAAPSATAVPASPLGGAPAACAPAITARVNAVELSIPPGAAEADISAAMRAADVALNPFTTPDRIYISRHPQDMRSGIQRLAALVATDFGCDPQAGALYCFVSRDCEKMKLLRFDVNGVYHTL